MSKTIVVLEGDQTGQELLEEALRVLDPGVTGVEVSLQRFDLSLEQRRATKNAVVRDAADAMLAAGLGLKAATITPEIKGDVGSPNAILRERVDGTVIVRTGRRIRACGRLAVSTRRSRSSAWPWAMPMVPRNGARAMGLTRWRFELSASHAGTAALWPSMHFCMPRRWARKSLVGRNTQLAQFTRAC